MGTTRPGGGADPPLTIRDASADDLSLVQDTIYRAMAWDPARVLPPQAHLMVHPELVRFHQSWGRAGDIGVVAVRNGDDVGMAFCRLFSDEDHGEGFVDARTPELVVAVAAESRARGIGGLLLGALADRARAAGFTQLSLSVDAPNPAVRLYRRLGFETMTEDARGVLMFKRL